MDFANIWQGIVSSFLWWFIIFGGGAVFSYIKSKNKQWTDVLLYGLIGAFMIGGLSLIINVRSQIIAEKESSTNIDNVQDKIRIWIDNFHLKNQSNPRDDVYFSYILTMGNGNNILVSRKKSQEYYISLQANLVPTEEEKALLTKASKEKVNELFSHLRIEAARQKMSSTMVDPVSKSIGLLKLIPIGKSLTEDILIGAIDDMDNGMVILQESYKSALQHDKLLKQK